MAAGTLLCIIFAVILYTFLRAFASPWITHRMPSCTPSEALTAWCACLRSRTSHFSQPPRTPAPPRLALLSPLPALPQLPTMDRPLLAQSLSRWGPPHATSRCVNFSMNTTVRSLPVRAAGVRGRCGVCHQLNARLGHYSLCSWHIWHSALVGIAGVTQHNLRGTLSHAVTAKKLPQAQRLAWRDMVQSL